MASTSFTIQSTPAYSAMVACVMVIAQEHGEEVALAWMSQQLESYFNLFFAFVSDARPSLRLVQGGKG